MLGDGQAPYLDRPPQNEQELRRLMDHTAEPEAFARWLEWAMAYVDPAEKPEQINLKSLNDLGAV